MFHKIVGLVFLLALFGCDFNSRDPQSIDREIRSNMDEQVVAWNGGDLEGFMKHYWNSDSLKFIGKSGLKTGWQTALDNYIKSYPDKSAMGTLSFDILSVEVLNDQNAFVIGKWRLDRVSDTLQGHYTLLWKNLKGDWVIVADHSS